jgi:hypothetical protein
MKARPACVHWNVREEFRDQLPGIKTALSRDKGQLRHNKSGLPKRVTRSKFGL